MKFHYLPKGDYKIGQVVDVAGARMRIESYSHTGRYAVTSWGDIVERGNYP